MAEMWLEVIEEGSYNYEITERGSSGIRTFVRWDDHPDAIVPAALPVVGSPTSLMTTITGGTITGCICRKMNPYFMQGSQNTPRLVFHYASEEVTTSSSPGDSALSDVRAEQYEIGIDQDSFTPNPDRADGDYWVFEGAASELNVVEQPLPLMRGTGQLVIPHPNNAMTEEERDEFIELANEARGALNAEAIRGYAVGQLMFVGATGGTIINGDDVVRYRFELRFEARTLQDVHADAAINTDAWLYVMNEREGRFRKPKTNIGGKFLYRKISFNDLLGIVPVP
jgi:hypothetical protein